MLDTGTLVVFVVVLLVVSWLTSGYKNLPPGPAAWPFIGNLPTLALHKNDIIPVFNKYAQTYGKVFRLMYGKYVVVVATGYEAVFEVLVKNGNVFSGRADFLWLAKQMGTGVIASSGATWKNLRRLALVSLRDLGMGSATIEEKVQEEVNVVLSILSDSDGQPINVQNTLSMASSNIICSFIFGSRFNYGDEYFLQLIQASNDVMSRNAVFTMQNVIPLTRYLPSKHSSASEVIKASNWLNQLIKQKVDEHEISFDKEHIRDFVDMYIKFKTEDKEVPYTEFHFLRLIADLLMAGTETLSTTLQWALLYMMAYSDVQTRCQEEIDDVVGRGRKVQLSDRPSMPYTQATIYEIQRLASVGPLAAPHAALSETTLCGYTIPKDTIVIPNLMSVHMDPTVWTEPEQFRPERFLNKGRVEKKDCFMPFSLGPRVCVGETLAKTELFLFFSNFLQHFVFTAPAGVTVTFDANIGVSRAPKYPFDIAAVRR